MIQIRNSEYLYGMATFHKKFVDINNNLHNNGLIGGSSIDDYYVNNRSNNRIINDDIKLLREFNGSDHYTLISKISFNVIDVGVNNNKNYFFPRFDTSLKIRKSKYNDFYLARKIVKR